MLLYAFQRARCSKEQLEKEIQNGSNKEGFVPNHPWLKPKGFQGTETCHCFPHASAFGWAWLQVGNGKWNREGIRHYGFRIHPKANPVNVHVYGERELIEYLAENGKPVKCNLELVVKKVSSDREFIIVNLYLSKPWLRETHAFMITGTSPDSGKRPWFVYTTKDMKGTGLSVEPL